jgi:3-phenylpropionate/trans-cinnamate dioxygenase ferredoxin reductase subunit
MASGPMTGPVVVVGAGHAGFQLAASLRQHGFAGEVVLIGDEPHLPYQRPPLSKDYLDGKIGLDLLLMRPEAFFTEHRIELVVGETAAEIDRAGKAVVLSSSKRIGYGHLVLATGARNRVPPLPGVELDGVCYLRNLAETDDLRQRLAVAQHCVVIGAGFIGLEFAAIARGKGKSVHIVELVDRVMARVVCPDTSAHFGEAHRKTGVEFSFGAKVDRIGGEGGRVTHVALADGRTLPADLVIVSIGVMPNEELAAAAGLAVENGVVVDELLRTADPAISAIGDCASFPSRHSQRNPVRLEAVQNAADHARCVADRLMGKPAPYAALPWFWSEQGALRLQIAGLTTGFQQVVLRGDYAGGEYSAFCYAGDKLLGIESINKPADHAFARRLLAAGRNVTPDQAADESFDLRAAAMARPPG